MKFLALIILMLLISCSKSDKDFDLIYSEAKNELSLDKANQAYNLAVLNDKDDQIAKSSYLLGYIYSSQNDRKQSLIYFFKALKKYYLLEEDYMMGTTLECIGLIYQNAEYFNNALEYYSKAIIHYKNNQDLNRENIVKYKIARIYGSTKKELTAINLFNEALDYFKSVENVRYEAFIYNEIGLCHRLLGNVDEAIHNFNKYSLLTSQMDKPLLHESKANHNIALTLHDSSRYELASEYYTLSLKHINNINDSSHISLVYNNYADLMDNMDDMDVASIVRYQSIVFNNDYIKTYQSNAVSKLLEYYIKTKNDSMIMVVAKKLSELSKNKDEQIKTLEKSSIELQIESATYKAKKEMEEATMILKKNNVATMIYIALFILICLGFVVNTKRINRKIKAKRIINKFDSKL